MFEHKTVLKEEAVEGLNIKPDGIYVDCTLGGGGHSRLIASRLSEQGKLFGLDQDENALRSAKEQLAPFGDRMVFVKSNFRYIKDILHEHRIDQVDGVLFDLGVSSPQLDEVSRGFTYNDEAFLDMRMDREQDFTAYDLIHSYDEKELAHLIFRYGEERFSKRIAREIVRQREQKPIETTTELVELIKQAIPAPARRKGPHPAKRTFQAIRIAVNDELNIFEKTLIDTIDVIKTRGRISVITFHSLEDRICKQTFREWSKGCICPPNLPQCACGNTPKLKFITKKPVLPREEEINENPRARSAKLRIAERV